MSRAIRVHDQLYLSAKNAAHAEFRTISNQIEFWAVVGKCAIDNPDLPVNFIVDTLIAKTRHISEAEPYVAEGKDEEDYCTDDARVQTDL